MPEKGLRLNQVAGAKLMLPNDLINPGFEIWKRGTGAFTADNVFTSDEWKIKRHASDTLAISRKAATIKFGRFSLKAVKTGANDSAFIRQGIEAYKSIEGLYVTFCAWVYTSTGSAARIAIGDYVSSEERANSGYHTGGGGWEQLKVTKQIRSSLAAYASYPHSFGAAAIVEIAPAATVYIDSAVLVVADVPFPEGLSYVPPNPASDLARCERFYEFIGAVGTAYPAAYFYGSASLTASIPYGFRARKYGIPTVTKTGTWGVANCSQPSPSYVSADGFCLVTTVTANGAFSFAPSGGADTVKAEVT